MKNMDAYEEIACNLCGSQAYTIKYKPSLTDYDPQKVFSASHGVRGTQQIVQCRECGLIYVNPRIKSGQVIQAYADSEDELYVSQASGRSKTFTKALKLVEAYAPEKGKILDVGAAAGFFLKVAKDAGWETYGAEPSKWLADWGNRKYGVNILSRPVTDCVFDTAFFNVVTMWDVLEHTPDPMLELQTINRVLKTGGILIINYPNIGSSLARLAGSKWWFLLSVHLYYFTHQSISNYLIKNGFEVLTIRRYIQTLSLEHLVKMFGLYSQTLSRIGIKIVNALKMNNWQMPYYASQANVIARKVKEVVHEK